MKKELLTSGCGARCRERTKRPLAVRSSVDSRHELRPRRFYESRLVQDADRVDVAGTAGDGAQVLAELGPTTGADGGSLRCRLASQWLYNAGRRAAARARNYGFHAGGVHSRGLDGERDEALGDVTDSGDFLCGARFTVVREQLDRRVESEPSARPFGVD